MRVIIMILPILIRKILFILIRINRGDYVKVEPIEASDEMGTSQQYLISGKFIRLDGK